MAQPTQELPSWFTASVSTLTDAGGIPFSTSTTLLYLPLTYYGPSIPLGPEWTYGGLTSPPSTAPTPISTATPTETSAIPSDSISSLTTSLSSPSPSSPSFTSSSTIPSSPSSVSPSSTSSSSPTPTMVSASRGSPSLIGIIIGSVFGGIFLLFVLGLYICLSRKRRRSQPRFSMVDPSDEEFYVVGSNDLPRDPGDGSPRGSGDEIDPFLTEHRSRQQMAQDGATVGLVTPRPPPRAPHTGTPPQTRPVSGAHTMSSMGSGTSGSGSGYGNLIDVPTLGISAGFGAYSQDSDNEDYRQRRGQILTAGELSRLDEESSVTHSQDAAGYSPLVPPPRLDPDQFGMRSGSATSLPRSGTPPIGVAAVPAQDSQGSLGTKRSSYPVDPEEAKTATVMTARRVKVEDLGPRSPLSEKSSAPTSPRSPTSPLLESDTARRRGSGAWLAGLGLGGLASSLGRLSWFKGSDSPRDSTSQYAAGPSTRRPSEYIPRALSDDEYEAGQAALLDPEKPDENLLQPTVRVVPVGLGEEGERPISSVSARSAASGNTVYHDAQSSLNNSSRGLPSPAPRDLPPSPSPVARSHTPHSQRQSGYYARDSGYGAEPVLNDPPSYDDANHRDMNPSPRASYPGATAISMEPPTAEMDILDLPVPSPVLPLRAIAPVTLHTSSSATDLPSIGSDAASGGSRSMRMKEGLLMPPGLWQDTSTITSGRETEGTSTRAGMDTPSFGSLAAQMRHMGGDDGPITIDVLEELPPSAGEGWRSLAQAHGTGRYAHGLDPSNIERRRTFGMPPHIIHPHEITNSEQGSLHSMRSHLSPGSGRSSGSAPASPPSSHGRLWTAGSIGSNSSRPSARSAAPSGSSASAMSLSHQGSFTRTRPGTDGIIISPAVSAFGHGTRSDEFSIPSRLPSPSSPTLPQQTYHQRPLTSSSGGYDALMPVVEHVHGDSTHTGSSESRSRSRPTSPPIQLPNVPWAGGLDHDWMPA